MRPMDQVPFRFFFFLIPLTDTGIDYYLESPRSYPSLSTKHCGLFLGWIVFNAVLRMKNSTNKKSIGQGVSILLAGICSVDAMAVCFFVPALMVPCYVVQFSAHILQKKFAAT